MRRIHLLVLFLTLTAAWATVQLGPTRQAWAYLIGNFWPDATNIVMDDVFLPAATWSNPAQFQLSEWNEVDTIDNSHAFRINANPEFSFSADDGDNTMGFLDESGLNSVYGLSYSSALAWAVCFSGSSGRYEECDIMLNSALPWQLVPDSDNFFQSTVLHEAGHVRGLSHYNSYLSMQNSGVDKILRSEVLYMDDKEGVRQNASHVSERDMVIYNKFHNGSTPQWMTVSPTTARIGNTINFNNITVENRGTIALGALRFGIYFSTNDIISLSDQLLNTGGYGSFGRFTFSTFNWSATVPFVNDCGTNYIGGIIDDNSAHAERFEGNNAVAFVNGSPNPQPFNILLERDGQEPNDSFGAPRLISLPFSSGSLNLDQDLEQDFYRFTLTQSRRVTTSVAFTHASGDVDLDLRDSNNVILQSSTSTGNSETIIRDLAPGTYYARVYGFGTGSCNRYSMTANATTVFPLTVTKAGTGSGTATSNPAGINCGADCSESYSSGTVVTLSAVPAADSVFAGWSNNADCTDGSVTMTAAKTCRATFNLIPPPSSITVTVPNGGQTWPISSIQTIGWTSSGLSGTVKIEVSRNGSGRPWTSIINSTANDGAHNWKVLGPGSTQARIRVCSVSNPAVCDISDANFTLGGGSLTVTVPNGGESWPIDSTQTIRWTSSGLSGTVKIEVSRNGSVGPWTAIINSTANDGAHNWKVKAPASSQARIRVCSVADPSVCDISNNNFTIP